MDIVFFFKYDCMDSEPIYFFVTLTAFSQCCLHLVCVRFYIVNPVITPPFGTSCEMCFWNFTASVLHSVAWIVMILNLFLFIAIVTFLKRKKSHDIKSGGGKGVVELHLVFSQKFVHRLEWAGALLWWRKTISPNSTFEIIFVAQLHECCHNHEYAVLIGGNLSAVQNNIKWSV